MAFQLFSLLGLGLYIIIWWTLIFAVLPFGLSGQGEANIAVPGADSGAPAQVHLGRVVVITTLVSALVWGVVACAIEFQWIDIDRWTAVLLRG